VLDTSHWSKVIRVYTVANTARMMKHFSLSQGMSRKHKGNPVRKKRFSKQAELSVAPGITSPYPEPAPVRPGDTTPEAFLIRVDVGDHHRTL
jgi:hypothetical protein